ncbi:MAG: hypothetical protein H7124_14065 [Phycisphaerales bacterium]|nr:hypothetical protein [Hyphomonadaceae bacterium]
MKTFRFVGLSAALLLLAPFAALAQETAAPAPPATTETAAPDEATIRIPAGTVIQVEFTHILSSHSSQVGQPFALRMVEPIIVDGVVAVLEGAEGGGEVIDAQAGGLGGRQGKLIVSGRHMILNGQRVRIRGLQVVTAGTDRTRDAVNMSLVPYVGVVAILVEGGEVEIAAGTRAEARIAADVVVARPLASPAETAAATAHQPVQTVGEQQ